MKLTVRWMTKGCSRVGNQEGRPILDREATEGLSGEGDF